MDEKEIFPAVFFIGAITHYRSTNTRSEARQRAAAAYTGGDIDFDAYASPIAALDSHAKWER
jgi:hypothetical protein